MSDSQFQKYEVFDTRTGSIIFTTRYKWIAKIAVKLIPDNGHLDYALQGDVLYFDHEGVDAALEYYLINDIEYAYDLDHLQILQGNYSLDRLFDATQNVLGQSKATTVGQLQATGHHA